MAEGKRKISVRRIFKRLVLILSLLLLILVLAFGGFVAYAVSKAPELDMTDVVPDGYRTTVLDDEGNVMLNLVGEESNRVYVGLEQMPQKLLDAFVAIEDSRFWTHHGIDIRGIIRAAWKDLTSGGIAEGASTITQQLIKNNVFSNWMEEKTTADKFMRKIQEQYLAIQLERNRSKDWILEKYLNTINLGGGSWGVETASLRYFDKNVSQLTLSECAVLAAVPQSPAAYDPVAHPEANGERRKLVLDKMLELGKISRSEYNNAVSDSVYDRISANASGVEVKVYSYFEDALLEQLVTDLGTYLGYPEDEAWALIFRGGLTIYTTQDTALQRLCEDTVNNDYLYSSDAQATVVMIDNATGQVKAIVGGRGEKNASLTFNRAVTSVRQPGSTIKIIGEYAAALERGYITLATVYDDAPYTYTNGTPIKNASGIYSGRTSIRTAIENSINIVALKCFQDIGMNAVWASLSNFGLSHLSTEDKVEALALGGTHGGVTNLEMTAAYAAIANKGQYTEPLFYTTILDRDGNVLLERKAESHRAVSPRTAALLTDAMKGVLVRGTGTQAFFEGCDLAGKTGTTTSSRDLWFVGFSPDFTCGVWGGYDDNSSQSATGYVKQLWKNVMQQAQVYCTNRGFDEVSGLTRCTVCTKCGNLAINGLCDSTVQGDQTREELFVSGTEPTAKCDCHIQVEICGESGLPANFRCPRATRESRVYLVAGTAGTLDESSVNPFDGDVKCALTHTSIFTPPFSGQHGQGQEQETSPTPGPFGNGGSSGGGGSDQDIGTSDSSGNGSGDGQSEPGNDGGFWGNLWGSFQDFLGW